MKGCKFLSLKSVKPIIFPPNRESGLILKMLLKISLKFKIQTSFPVIPELSFYFSNLIWIYVIISFTFVIMIPKQSVIRAFVAALILRLIFSIGPEPTLWFLGSLTVIFKGIHMVSIMGNCGTLEKKLTAIITDGTLLYHFGYVTFCVCGILLHPFFYSVLVRGKFNEIVPSLISAVFSFLMSFTAKKHFSMSLGLLLEMDGLLY